MAQYKYLKSCSSDLILQNLILRARSCVTGFITQHSCFFISAWQKSVRRKCLVPQLYQLRRVAWLPYFYLFSFFVYTCFNVEQYDSDPFDTEIYWCTMIAFLKIGTSDLGIGTFLWLYHTFILLVNAGRTTDFWNKKSSDFSGEIFRERNLGSSITALQPCSH